MSDDMIDGMPETIRLHLWPVDLRFDRQDSDGRVWWSGKMPNGATVVVASRPGQQWLQVYVDTATGRASVGVHAPTLIEAERILAGSRDAMEAASRVTDALRIETEVGHAAE